MGVVHSAQPLHHCLIVQQVRERAAFSPPPDALDLSVYSALMDETTSVMILFQLKVTQYQMVIQLWRNSARAVDVASMEAARALMVRCITRVCALTDTAIDEQDLLDRYSLGRERYQLWLARREPATEPGLGDAPRCDQLYIPTPASALSALPFTRLFNQHCAFIFEIMTLSRSSAPVAIRCATALSVLLTHRLLLRGDRPLVGYLKHAWPALPSNKMMQDAVEALSSALVIVREHNARLQIVQNNLPTCEHFLRSLMLSSDILAEVERDWRAHEPLPSRTRGHTSARGRKTHEAAVQLLGQSKIRVRRTDEVIDRRNATDLLFYLASLLPVSRATVHTAHKKAMRFYHGQMERSLVDCMAVVFYDLFMQESREFLLAPAEESEHRAPNWRVLSYLVHNRIHEAAAAEYASIYEDARRLTIDPVHLRPATTVGQMYKQDASLYMGDVQTSEVFMGEVDASEDCALLAIYKSLGAAIGVLGL